MEGLSGVLLYLQWRAVEVVVPYSAAACLQPAECRVQSVCLCWTGPFTELEAPHCASSIALRYWEGVEGSQHHIGFKSTLT